MPTGSVIDSVFVVVVFLISWGSAWGSKFDLFASYTNGLNEHPLVSCYFISIAAI